MTLTHSFSYKHLLSLWAGVLALVLGFPVMGLAIGYGDGHHPSSGHGKSPHGGASYGHGKSHHRGSLSSGYGMKGRSHQAGHGPHQSASKFIDHILKFKEGMAITDEQAAKLQAIKTDFKKQKIKMKADIQLTSVDLHELLRNDQGDLGAVESTLKKLFEIRADLYMASVKAGRDAKAVLTDEQRSRMKAVHERINAYREGGNMQGHPDDDSRPSKEQDS